MLHGHFGRVAAGGSPREGRCGRAAAAWRPLWFAAAELPLREGRCRRAFASWPLQEGRCGRTAAAWPLWEGRFGVAAVGGPRCGRAAAGGGPLMLHGRCRRAAVGVPLREGRCRRALHEIECMHTTLDCMHSISA